MIFLDLCDLAQLVYQPTHLREHIFDLILIPSDQDTIVHVKNFYSISDHALVKCSIAFLHQVAHIPNKVQYKGYHCIDMSDLHYGLKNPFFVKSTANAVVDLFEQYVYDLVDVLDKYAPLVSRLTKERFCGLAV